MLVVDPSRRVALGYQIIGEVMREAFRVARFNCEIKLAFERAAQFADHLDRPVATDFGHLTLDMREASRSLRSASIFASIPGRQLQDHWRATRECGPV